MRKIFVGMLVAGGLLVGGLWWFWDCLFSPTNNADVNRKLIALEPGESLKLEDVFGTDAERVCWIVPAYSYYRPDNFGEKYISQLLGATVNELPLHLGDEESGSDHLFIRYAEGKIVALELGSSWLEYKDNLGKNWCADMESGKIERNKEGWWTFKIPNKKKYNLPE